MRVFMLGWEFPPFITGGLGTACHGLTKALARQHTQVVFVLPKEIGSEYSSHVRLLAPQSPRAAEGDRHAISVASTYEVPHDSGAKSHPVPGSPPGPDPIDDVVFKAVPSRITSPYQSAGGKVHQMSQRTTAATGLEPIDILSNGGGGGPTSRGTHASAPSGNIYAGDLIQETRRYADLCVALAASEQFDVIHAHDWMTYPAGLAVAAATGKPLVVHVHSTEFDRSGDQINQQVYDIERRGMHGAMRVIAVSQLTKAIIERSYGVNADKIDVVYNGIENGQPQSSVSPPLHPSIAKHDKIVLFLGRITMQKGPEYFIHAAKKVLAKMDDVKFVMAGSGDKVRDIIELAAEQGIGQKVLFTGFLRGKDVARIFNMADLYVMPSVSEPFGIACLEAISHDVPVIISKTSGVSEVLNHALKVDFWDVDEMANKIIAVLRHPPLASTLREHADLEVRRLTWDGAASRCLQIYQHAADAMPV